MPKAPAPPKLFLCETCNLFFFSFSKLVKPTHPKCFGHKTRLATDLEIDNLNEANPQLHIQYNEGEKICMPKSKPKLKKS